MCDYSLMAVPNRLALEGDDLIVYRFPTGSLGLIASTDRRGIAGPVQKRQKGIRLIVKRLFGHSEENKIAVCVPPGARLLLGDISESVQHLLNVCGTEEVTFTQLNATPNTYRDAVRFRNGRELLLQRLNEGQRIRVLRLWSEEPIGAWQEVEPFGWRARGSSEG